MSYQNLVDEQQRRVDKDDGTSRRRQIRKVAVQGAHTGNIELEETHVDRLEAPPGRLPMIAEDSREASLAPCPGRASVARMW